MNMNTEFISAIGAWCREHEIVWEYNSFTKTHYFTKMPFDPIERSLQECFGESFPTCLVIDNWIKAISDTFDQGNGNMLSLTDYILSVIGVE